jgi:transcriptional regulator
VYLPSHFEVTERARLEALMREHPLAHLVRTGDAGLDADPIPLLLDASGQALQGHVARANPLTQLAAATPVLAIFSGPQAYVSPNWYPSKASSHKVVPTWNYAVVHVHGRLELRDDPAWVHEFVARFTARQEGSRQRPWAVSDAPADYVQQMLRAIVGIEIRISRVVGKVKASQNRSAADREGVVAALGSHPMAALVAESSR